MKLSQFVSLIFVRNMYKNIVKSEYIKTFVM